MKKDIKENKTMKVLNYARKATQGYNERFAKCAMDFGLKESEAHILVFLYINREYNIASHIVANRGFSKAYVSKCLATLKDKGLIENVDIEGDKRFQQINLTNKGLEVCAAFSEKHNEIVKEATNGIAEEEIEVFFNVLKKLYENLGGDDLHA